MGRKILEDRYLTRVTDQLEEKSEKAKEEERRRTLKILAQKIR